MLVLLACAMLALQPFDTQMERASARVRPLMKRAEALVVEGKISEANTLLLGAFPEASRTPVECLMLGNVLYKQLPATSYELHKKAAAALPEAGSAQLEWAMEQHRAGEHAGASKAYEAYLKTEPGFAPAWGLLAECRIRAGDVPGAIEAWNKSEKAKTGSLAKFEEFVCEVNGQPASDADREKLLRSLAAADCPAAANLLVMDCDWERDWWNAGPRRKYLEHDLPLVKASPCAGDREVKEALAAAACALAEDEDEQARKTAVESALKDLALFSDASHLPQNTGALAVLLKQAIRAEVLQPEAAREKLGAALRTHLKGKNDRNAWNALAQLYIDTPDHRTVAREAWEATADPKCAAVWLLFLYLDHQLKPDSDDLVKALKQSPEDADLAQIALLAAAESGAPLEPPLIAAIKAEYRHFSARPLALAAPRARANALRNYFKSLERVRAGHEKDVRKELSTRE